MRRFLKSRLALSTVVTSLIILVVSVLLAGVVTYYAINVTSTRVQEEDLSIMGLHIWVPSNGDSPEAAFVIINTGGRDVIISKITVRGQAASIPASDGGLKDIVYATTNKAVNQDLEYILAVCTGSDTVQIDSSPADDIVLSVATASVTLESGNSMVVYVSMPDSITLNDIGLTVGVTVFTSQAMYYQECNVQTYVPGI
jgi:hypothetical protein